VEATSAFLAGLLGSPLGTSAALLVVLWLVLKS
jgi:hypothetical protein